MLEGSLLFGGLFWYKPGFGEGDPIHLGTVEMQWLFDMTVDL